MYCVLTQCVSCRCCHLFDKFVQHEGHKTNLHLIECGDYQYQFAWFHSCWPLLLMSVVPRTPVVVLQVAQFRLEGWFHSYLSGWQHFSFFIPLHFCLTFQSTNCAMTVLVIVWSEQSTRHCIYYLHLIMSLYSLSTIAPS